MIDTTKPKFIVCTVTNDLIHDQRMQRICTTLQLAGYNVTLVGRLLPKSKSIPNWPFLHHRISCVFHKGALFYAEYNWRLLWYLVQKKDLDAVCSIDFDTLPAGTMAAFFRGKKRVFDAHEYFTETPEVTNRPLIKAAWAAIGRIFLLGCRHAYTVGPTLADIFSKKHNIPFSVVRNVPFRREAVSAKVWKKGETKIILYQGALNEGRGIETAIEAMHILPPYIALNLAGEGDLSEKLRSIVVEKGLQNRVRFLGMLSPVDLQKHTDEAWIGLNLLENKGKSYYFSLANKFFDYMQAGVPSINMDFPEYRKIVEQYPVALLIPHLDSRLLSEKILQLDADLTLYGSLQDACTKASQDFFWEKEAETLQRIWERVFEK